MHNNTLSVVYQNSNYTQKKLSVTCMGKTRKYPQEPVNGFCYNYVVAFAFLFPMCSIFAFCN